MSGNQEAMAKANETSFEVEARRKGFLRQEWISVKDRLPERGKQVLAVWCGIAITAEHSSLRPGQFFSPLFRGYLEITHWMPMPGPPIESEANP